MPKPIRWSRTTQPAFQLRGCLVLIFFFLFAGLLILPVVSPSIDLLASGLFYHSGQGFFLADNPVFTSFHWLAYYGARGLGVAFAILALGAWRGRKSFCTIDAKGWFFLLLALLIGPVLIANVGLKDHWGRARPREIVEFGGASAFTPALEAHFERAHDNGSFVAGDAAFGFFLTAFAFVAPRRTSRRVFWSMMGIAGLFSLSRLVMGAHFLSDIIYAAFFMLQSVTATHAAFYGRNETAARWRGYFKRTIKS